MNIFTSRQQTVPLRQGDEERSDGGGGQDKQKREMNTYPLLPITYPPPPHCVVLPLSQVGESGCSAIAGTLSPLFPVVILSARRSGNYSPHMGTEIHWYFFIDPVRPSLAKGLEEWQSSAPCFIV